MLKDKTIGAKVHAAFIFREFDAARKTREVEFFELRRNLSANPGKVDVGEEPRDAAGIEADPRARGPRSCAHDICEADALHNAREVDARKVRISLSLPGEGIGLLREDVLFKPCAQIKGSCNAVRCENA